MGEEIASLSPLSRTRDECFPCRSGEVGEEITSLSPSPSPPPPHATRERGVALRISGGFSERRCHRLLDERYDVLRPKQHVVVREPKYAIALSTQYVFPFEIIPSLKLMDRTVDLDHQTMFDAQEIDDIHSKRNLPPEFRERMFAEQLPHANLRVCHPLSKLQRE
jgi:hypothetical protein